MAAGRLQGAAHLRAARHLPGVIQAHWLDPWAAFREDHIRKRIDCLCHHIRAVRGRKPASVLRFDVVLRAASRKPNAGAVLCVTRSTWPRRRESTGTSAARPPVAAVLRRTAAVSHESGDNALVLRLVAGTGCRRSEVVILPWGDLDFGAYAGTVTGRRPVVELKRELIAGQRPPGVKCSLLVNPH